MTSPRIAYVINSVEGGGAALPVPAVTSVLRDCGASVRVFALTPADRRALPVMQKAGLDPLVRDGGKQDHLATLLWLRRELLAWGATHIWTSLSRASLLGLLLGPAMGLPVICWQHAAFLKPWNRRLLRLLQHRAALWVGDSAAVTALTAQRLAVPKDRLTCWPIFSADPAMPQATPWKPGEQLRLGSLGRLHAVKGYDVLIAALAMLKANGFRPPVPFTVEIAGDGPERQALQHQIETSGLGEIRLAGYTDDPQAFLAALHLYLQPSRSEGFCIAAHEAMAAGLPVVASSVGEMPYSIVSGVTGALADAGNPAALASALQMVLSAPEKLETMGSAARAFIQQRYSHDQFVQNGRAIFNRIFPEPA
jgi:glycosyltransferase involved in cell wall biosynthesis